MMRLHPRPRRVASALALTLASFGPAAAGAGGLWFPPELLDGENGVADLSAFEKGHQQPGIYRVSIFLNRNFVEMRDVRFLAAREASPFGAREDATGLQPCLSKSDLIAFGVRAGAFNGLEPSGSDQACDTSLARIEQAGAELNFSAMRLDISVPQKWMSGRTDGDVDPELWDDGISAGLLDYQFSSTRTANRLGHAQDYFLRLKSGVNAGPWRLRDERTFNGRSGTRTRGSSRTSGRTSLERGIKSWRSIVTLGDATTSGELFTAANFRGAQLASAEEMWASSQQGYAPVVRGYASTNAQVSIRQNGYVLQKINVAPGPFAIDDLGAVYNSGDLKVTVTEADGSEQHFTVPYATVPTLVRPGAFRYALSLGRLHDGAQRDAHAPFFGQATVARGFEAGITGYAGIQYSPRYRAVAVGAGVDMGVWGAASVDLTHADSTLTNQGSHRGQSLRLLYGRAFESTGTSVRVAGYQYATRGFYTLEKSAHAGQSGEFRSPLQDGRGNVKPDREDARYEFSYRPRHRLEAGVYQSIGDATSLYINAAHQKSWGGQGNQTSLQAGLSGRIRSVNYSLNFSQTRVAASKRTDRGVYLTMSVPFDSVFGKSGSPVYANASFGRGRSGEIVQRTGLSGTALENRNLNWSITQGTSSRASADASAKVLYRGRYAEWGAAHAEGRDYRQTNVNMAGGAIIHSNGITLGRPLGETNVLVAAPGASDVPLAHSSGAPTDWRGYAIQPWSNDYQVNRVALDVTKLKSHVDIDRPVANVIPTKGAVVRADFRVKQGMRVLFRIEKDNKPLPFGAQVSADQSIGIVGDDGVVYLSGLARQGSLTATWGQSDKQSCRGSWRLEGEVGDAPLMKADVICQ